MRKLLLLGLALSCGGTSRALGPEATKEDIIAELGKPTSVATKEDREILIYPKGVRLELLHGRIVSVRGLVLQEQAGTEVVPAAVAPPVPQAKGVTPAPTAAMKPAPKTPRVAPPPEAEARTQMEDALLAAEQLHSPPPPSRDTGFNPKRVAVEFVLRWVFVLVVLKLASKYWSSEISWRGLAIASAADVTIRMTVRLVALLTLHIPTLFYADDAIATLGLVVVLRKVSYNHSLAKAVEIAFSAKVFATVVGALLFTLALRFLF